MKEQAIRPKTPLTLEDAKHIVGGCIDYYNGTRLHSAIEYITPDDRLADRHIEIFATREKRSKPLVRTANSNATDPRLS